MSTLDERTRPRMRAAILLFAQTALAALGFVTTRPTRSRSAVVLASNGDANIGDSALFEAFVGNVDGPVVALARDPGSYPIASDDADRVRVEATRMIWAGRLDRARAFVAFGRVLRSASSFSVLGADNMDGGYGDHFALSEWASAIIAVRLGVPSRVVGFSWSGEATAGARDAAVLAARLGVRLYPRDPVSAGRLPALALSSSVTTADIAFLLGPPDAQEPWRQRISERAAGSRICLLNVSALIASRIDLTSDYRTIVDGLLGMGYHIALVPHVGGRGNDDRQAARDLLASLCDRGRERVTVVDELLSPLGVKALAEGSDLVITGRMHLSVLALSVGKPVIVFSTQGKVEGLLGYFGLGGHVIDPRPGMSARVLAIAADEAALEAARASIRQSLPAVMRLAALNLVGLLKRWPAPALGEVDA